MAAQAAAALHLRKKPPESVGDEFVLERVADASNKLADPARK